MITFSDTNKIGFGLLSISCVCYASAIIFLFDRSLALLANITFFVGLYFLIGLLKMISFFCDKQKLKGSMFFFGGFLVIFIHLSLIGICLQLIGLFLIFKSFFPFLFEWMMSLPGIGTWLSWVNREQSTLWKSLYKNFGVG